MYFTNSFAPEIYLLPWSGPGHKLPSSVITIPLTGDWDQLVGANIHANGIAVLPDQTLYIIHSTSGILYRVFPNGVAQEVSVMDLAGEPTTSLAGDGILLDGKTLYIVQDISLNRVRVFDMTSATTGREIKTITDAYFDDLTTIAKVGDCVEG